MSLDNERVFTSQFINLLATMLHLTKIPALTNE